MLVENQVPNFEMAISFKLRPEYGNYAYYVSLVSPGYNEPENDKSRWGCRVCVDACFWVYVFGSHCISPYCIIMLGIGDI